MSDASFARAARGLRGFTLLELLLVVFILSALALTATAFVDNQDDQFRYEDTRRRLLLIRRAVVGDAAAVNAGQTLLSGYVVDNGDLPGNLDALIAAKPAGFVDAGPQDPLFDPAPGAADGMNDGGEITLSAVEEKAHKGWRPGNVQAAPGSPGDFRDGWGTTPANGTATPALAAANDGWQWAGTGGALSVSSLGRDRRDALNGGLTGAFDSDMTATLNEDDWTVPLANISVRVKAAADHSGGLLRASLLVFHNDGTAARWRRYTTSSNAVTCLDGNGDGLAGGSPCPTSDATLSFTAHGWAAPWGARVPIGRHLLVLVSDTDAAVHNGESPHLNAMGQRITAPIHCFAAGCTIETLILR